MKLFPDFMCFKNICWSTLHFNACEHENQKPSAFVLFFIDIMMYVILSKGNQQNILPLRVKFSVQILCNYTVEKVAGSNLTFSSFYFRLYKVQVKEIP